MSQDKECSGWWYAGIAVAVIAVIITAYVLCKPTDGAAAALAYKITLAQRDARIEQLVKSYNFEAWSSQTIGAKYEGASNKAKRLEEQNANLIAGKAELLNDLSLLEDSVRDKEEKIKDLTEELRLARLDWTPKPLPPGPDGEKSVIIFPTLNMVPNQQPKPEVKKAAERKTKCCYHIF